MTLSPWGVFVVQGTLLKQLNRAKVLGYICGEGLIDQVSVIYHPAPKQVMWVMVKGHISSSCMHSIQVMYTVGDKPCSCGWRHEGVPAKLVGIEMVQIIDLISKMEVSAVMWGAWGHHICRRLWGVSVSLEQELRLGEMTRVISNELDTWVEAAGSSPVCPHVELDPTHWADPTQPELCEMGPTLPQGKTNPAAARWEDVRVLSQE